MIRHDEAGAPRYSLVSGSASKLTGVRSIPGMVYGLASPGYMALLVRENGAVDLRVLATEPNYLACPEQDEEGALLDWSRCMREGVRAFESVYETRLTGPLAD